MINLYIDTDMGYDDIMALTLLINVDVSIQGISVVEGVATQDQGLKNLFRLATWLNLLSIPVYQGESKYLQATNVAFPSLDRQRADKLTLLNNLTLPSPISTKTRSVKDLITAIATTNKPVTLLCLGPLTTVAKVINSKAAKANIDRLVVMGGAVNVPGNIASKKQVEYNFGLDPEATRQVFQSRLPITLVALDSTKSAPARMDTAGVNSKSLSSFLRQISSITPRSPKGKLIQAIIKNNQTDLDYYYDPVAAAVITNPEIIVKQQRYTIIVTPSGQTIGRKDVNGSVTLVEKIDTTAFYQLLLNTMKGGETI